MVDPNTFDDITDNESIPIITFVDENTTQYAETLAKSICANLKSTNKYSIIFIKKNVDNSSLYGINSFIEENGITAHFIDTDEYLNKYDFEENDRILEKIILSIPFAFSNIDKAIWIDVHSIVNSDVSELYNMNIGKTYVAATRDLFKAAKYYTRDKSAKNLIESVIGIDPYEYLYTNVMLINSKVIREELTADFIFSLLKNPTVRSIDEIVNFVSNGHNMILDSRWCVCSDFNSYATIDSSFCAEYIDACLDPFIINYPKLMNEKPGLNMHLGRYYWSYVQDECSGTQPCSENNCLQNIDKQSSNKFPSPYNELLTNINSSYVLKDLNERGISITLNSICGDTTYKLSAEIGGKKLQFEKKGFLIARIDTSIKTQIYFYYDAETKTTIDGNGHKTNINRVLKLISDIAKTDNSVICIVSTGMNVSEMMPFEQKMRYVGLDKFIESVNKSYIAVLVNGQRFYESYDSKKSNFTTVDTKDVQQTCYQHSNVHFNIVCDNSLKISIDNTLNFNEKNDGLHILLYDNRLRKMTYFSKITIINGTVHEIKINGTSRIMTSFELCSLLFELKANENTAIVVKNGKFGPCMRSISDTCFDLGLHSIIDSDNSVIAVFHNGRISYINESESMSKYYDGPEENNCNYNAFYSTKVLKNLKNPVAIKKTCGLADIMKNNLKIIAQTADFNSVLESKKVKIILKSACFSAGASSSITINNNSCLPSKKRGLGIVSFSIKKNRILDSKVFDIYEGDNNVYSHSFVEKWNGKRISNYLDSMKNEELLLLTVNDNAEQGVNPVISKSLKNIGINKSKFKSKSYIAVIYKGKLIYELSSSYSITKSFGSNSDELSKIKLSKEELYCKPNPLWTYIKGMLPTAMGAQYEQEKKITEKINALSKKVDALKPKDKPKVNTAVCPSVHKITGKVRILFIFQMASFWPSWGSVYKYCKQCEDVDFKIFLLKEEVHEHSQTVTAEQFLIDNNIDYTLYDDSVLRDFDPHIIVLQTPYDGGHRTKDKQAKAFKDRNYNVVYITYGIEIADTQKAMSDHFEAGVVLNSWRIYTFSETMADMYRRDCINGSAARCFGHPKFDGLFDSSIKERTKLFKEKAMGRPIIVWHAHFPKVTLVEGTYRKVTPNMNEYVQFLEYIHNHKELFFVFMPHPKFKENRAGEELISHLESEGVYIDYSDDYRPTLYSANAIITDRSAIMVESATLGIPVLYMHNSEYNEPMTAAVQPIIDSLYNGCTYEDMSEFVDMAIRGEDPMKDFRTETIRKIMPPIDGLAGKRIVDDMVNSIKAEQITEEE